MKDKFFLVEVSYNLPTSVVPGFDFVKSRDTECEQLVGRKRTSSGFYIPGGIRDLAFKYFRRRNAVLAAKKLRRAKYMARVLEYPEPPEAA